MGPSLGSGVKVFEMMAKCPPLSPMSNLLPQSAEYRWNSIIEGWGGGVGGVKPASIHTTDQSRRKKRECMEEIQELNFSSWAF